MQILLLKKNSELSRVSNVILNQNQANQPPPNNITIFVLPRIRWRWREGGRADGRRRHHHCHRASGHWRWRHDANHGAWYRVLERQSRGRADATPVVARARQLSRIQLDGVVVAGRRVRHSLVVRWLLTRAR